MKLTMKLKVDCLIGGAQLPIWIALTQEEVPMVVNRMGGQGSRGSLIGLHLEAFLSGCIELTSSFDQWALLALRLR